jgi:hypothetical protein
MGFGTVSGCHAAHPCYHPAMSPKSIQSAFFASMTDPQAFRLMFDQQPNVFFFVKSARKLLWQAAACR